ncbi:hypothetical protein [Mycetocola spongiae]|uniref:hypothetical protein n=1 Tax=Mycetocola spongiae TaxID=2859226 RepID=UPI001CF2A97C|nr:hypothetical protein [Mycetocola spongiae]UCR90256.1 hypothetical protein KXZ72_06270 [Mycetocola spongiae]
MAPLRTPFPSLRSLGRIPRALLVPALTIAAAASVVSAASWGMSRVLRRTRAGEPRLEDLTPGARALIEGMLEFTGDHGSAALRAQLALARERVYPEGGPEVWLSVDEPAGAALPLAVPHRYTFPVSARFISDGVPMRARLDIEEGRLDILLLEPDPEAGGAASFSAPIPWPVRADVTYSIDTADPRSLRD